MADRQDLDVILHHDVGMGHHLRVLRIVWQGQGRGVAVMVPPFQVCHDPEPKIMDLAPLSGHNRHRRLNAHKVPHCRERQ